MGVAYRVVNPRGGRRMKALRVLALVAFVAATLVTFNAGATQADAKKTGKACTFCHKDIKTPKELNDAGKYYKEKKTLDGYKAPVEKK
jgi:hypothetical protein